MGTGTGPGAEPGGRDVRDAVAAWRRLPRRIRRGSGHAEQSSAGRATADSPGDGPGRRLFPQSQTRIGTSLTRSHPGFRVDLDVDARLSRVRPCTASVTVPQPSCRSDGRDACGRGVLRKATMARRSAAGLALNRRHAAASPPCCPMACSNVRPRPSWRWGRSRPRPRAAQSATRRASAVGQDRISRWRARPARDDRPW